MADNQEKETLSDRWLRSLKNRRAVAVGVIVGTVIIGIAAVLTGIASFPESVDKLTKRYEGDPVKPGVAKNIFAECNYGLWPSTIPPNGRIYVTQIQSSSAPSSLGYVYGAPGSQSSGFGPYKFAYECKLTNYNIFPGFDVRISLHAIFREAIVPPSSPTGRTTGAVKATREWPLVIQNIDPGKENPFVFYIINFSPDFVDISLPRTITLRGAGDQAEQTAPLNQSSNILIVLMPFNEDK